MKINALKIEKAVQVLSSLQSTYPLGFPKEMKGDISSFGASIVQSGLLPSVMFFSEGDLVKLKNTSGDEGTKLRRARLMKVIFDVLEAPQSGSFKPERPLLDYVRQSLDKSSPIDDITEAAIAVKMALRAFPFDETTPQTP
jgi:CRISPR-associated protein Cmr5